MYGTVREQQMPADAADLPILTLQALAAEATQFSEIESAHWEHTIYCVRHAIVISRSTAS